MLWDCHILFKTLPFNFQVEVEEEEGDLQELEEEAEVVEGMGPKIRFR